MNRIIVVAVHPDDETLGCGGTLLKHKANGDKIYWLIATTLTSENGFTRREILEREVRVKMISKLYKFDGIYQLKIPTMEADKAPKKIIRDHILAIFGKVKPNIVYLPFKEDIHSDHRVIFEMVYSCTKTFRFPFVKKVLMMEIVSETEFAPALKEFTFIELKLYF